jgi:two-component system OmpR family response regulator
MRILLIEDDQMIGEAVTIALKDAAYAVDWVKDGLTASSVLELGEHQAVLLDLRQSGNIVPVIVITAREGVDDRIKGLDLGADDYLIKPFDIKELLARLRAIVRRRGGQAAALLSNGIVSLDQASHEARCGDTTVILSAREFSLLHALLNLKSASMAGTRKWKATLWIF